jgi:hypothetical protein
VTQSIFVFGSNLAGRHGAGAARTARMFHGAVYGDGEGRTGNAYAIPTLDGQFCKLQPRRIHTAVNDFVDYAKAHPELDFFVTRIGCGLAGFTDAEIAPMFKDVPVNCQMPIEWKPYFDEHVSAHLTFYAWDPNETSGLRPPSVDHMP